MKKHYTFTNATKVVTYDTFKRVGEVTYVVNENYRPLRTGPENVTLYLN